MLHSWLVRGLCAVEVVPVHAIEERMALQHTGFLHAVGGLSKLARESSTVK